MPDGPLYPFAVEVAARFWPGVQKCALMGEKGHPVLVVQGSPVHLSDWKTSAGAFGISDIRHIERIPMDRRHQSKIDRPALLRLMGNMQAR